MTNRKWVYLNKLNITGNISIRTPLCVLEEIVITHNVQVSCSENREQIVNSILSHRNLLALSTDNAQNMTQRDWENLGKFINPNEDWDYTNKDNDNQLIVAFDFLKKFEKSIDISSLPISSLGFGRPTIEKPKCLSACILYGILRRERIQVNPDDSFDDLAKSFILLSFNKDFLIQTIINGLTTFSKSGITNILNALKIYPTLSINWDNVLSYFNTRSFINSGSGFGFVQTDIAATNEEAIVLAFEKWKIDISSAISPLAEYNCQSSEYVPNDGNMKEIAFLYGNNIQLKFNPYFPLDAYSENFIDIAKFEGFTDLEIDYDANKAATLVQDIYIPGFPNIFPGILAPCVNQTTMMGINVCSLSPEDAFSYGSYGGPYHILSISELNDLFQSKKEFSNPISSDTLYFRMNTVRKMRNLLSNKSTISRRKLLDTINDIEASQISLKTRVENLQLFAQTNKQELHTIFMALLEAGMFMRGWTGSGSYPLRGFPIDSQDEVDNRVVNAVLRFENLVDHLPKDISNQILSLPLINYDNYSDRAIHSTSDCDGITIRDRLNIIKMGELAGTSSCLRISSGWIIITALFHMENYNLPTPLSYKKIKKTQEVTDNDN